MKLFLVRTTSAKSASFELGGDPPKSDRNQRCEHFHIFHLQRREPISMEGPSEMDEFYTPPEYGTEVCPTHGTRQVLDEGSTGGPDPYGTQLLACGCEIMSFGPAPEDTHVVRVHSPGPSGRRPRHLPHVF